MTVDDQPDSPAKPYQLTTMPSPIDTGFMWADGLRIRLDMYIITVKIMYEPYKLATTRKALKGLCASLDSDDNFYAVGDVLGPAANRLADALQQVIEPLGVGVRLTMLDSNGGTEVVIVQRGTFKNSVEIARILMG